MKHKLFENVGGNRFKLITEGVIADENPKGKLVREGLRKVFSAGNKEISYKRLQGVGMGYIKSVEEAKKCALQEARELASEYGYAEDENSQRFVKEDEANLGDPKEAREVQIGREILNLLIGSSCPAITADRIKALAQELITMHGAH